MEASDRNKQVTAQVAVYPRSCAILVWKQGPQHWVDRSHSVDGVGESFLEELVSQSPKSRQRKLHMQRPNAGDPEGDLGGQSK